MHAPQELTLATTHDIPHECDILVNGGGMVGLCLSLALAQQGFDIVVLDAQPAPPEVARLRATLGDQQFDSRVSALTPGSQSWLQQLGVWDALADLRVCAYSDMHVWDADGTGSIHFTAEEVHRPCLGHIVENRLICAVLHEALRQLPQVKLCNNHTLAAVEQAVDTSNRALVVCDNGAAFSFRLLIGADGGSSLVRKLCAFTTREWSYQQQAIVCTIKTAVSHQFTAWQRFMSGGPLAVLPLLQVGAQSQHCSSIVWSCDDDKAAALMALSEPAFAQELQRAFESRLGAMEIIAPRQVFPLHQQHAIHYAKPGVVLVGDAAHTLHPLAGQGVNLGLADAECLAQVLTKARQRGEDIAAIQTLSRYQRERKGPNLGMMLSMEMFKRAFGSDALMLRWLRNTGLRVANQNLALKRTLIQHAMGLPV